MRKILLLVQFNGTVIGKLGYMVLVMKMAQETLVLPSRVNVADTTLYTKLTNSVTWTAGNKLLERLLALKVLLQVVLVQLVMFMV